MKKLRFKIGDFVQFNECASFKYDIDGDNPKERIIIKKHPMKRETYDHRELPSVVGQIVGCTHKYTGIHEHDNYGDESGYCAWLDHRKSHFAWKVAIGMMSPHVLVLDNDIKPADLPEGFVLPTKFSKYPITEKDRKALSEESKSYKRDKSGRFA